MNGLTEFDVNKREYFEATHRDTSSEKICLTIMGIFINKINHFLA